MLKQNDYTKRIRAAVVRAHPEYCEHVKRGDFKVEIDESGSSHPKLSIRWPNSTILHPDQDLIALICAVAFPDCPPDRVEVKAYGLVGLEISCKPERR